MLLRESPNLRKREKSEGSGFLAELIRVFSLASVRGNTELYLVFIAIAVFSISQQIVTPFEIIYLNNYLDISKSLTGLITALVAPVLIIFALPIGRLSDRGFGFPLLFCGFTVSAAGQFLFSLTGSIALLTVFGIMKNIGFLMLIILGAWARNLIPEDSRGQFQGVRLIFMVMLPMIIGPAIGSALIGRFGIPTIINGGKRLYSGAPHLPGILRGNNTEPSPGGNPEAALPKTCDKDLNNGTGRDCSLPVP